MGPAVPSSAPMACRIRPSPLCTQHVLHSSGRPAAALRDRLYQDLKMCFSVKPRELALLVTDFSSIIFYFA